MHVLTNLNNEYSSHPTIISMSIWNIKEKRQIRLPENINEPCPVLKLVASCLLMEKIREKGTNWTNLKFEQRMRRKSSLRIKNMITKHLWQWKTAADIAIQQEDMRLKQNKIHLTNDIITQTIIRQLLYAKCIRFYICIWHTQY